MNYKINSLNILCTHNVITIVLRAHYLGWSYTWTIQITIAMRLVHTAYK